MHQEAGLTTRELLRETVLGYLFWTVFQALAPMIWFYPLNELELSGYEGFAVVLFSPLLLGMPGGVGQGLRGHAATSFLRVVCVASLTSFQAPSTLTRLIFLCVGCFCAMLLLAIALTHPASRSRSQTIDGLVLGLLAFVSSRVWFTSFAPAWWNVTSNSAVIAIATVATCDKIMSTDAEALPEPSSKSTASEPRPGAPSAHASSPEAPPCRGSWVFTGVGLGALLWTTQAVLGEASLISRWVVKGYPDPGPAPHPWGACVVVAMFVGALLARSLTPLLASHPPLLAVWSLIGSAGFCTLYLQPTWQGFTGGLLLVVYIVSIWPLVGARVFLCPPAATLGLASLSWLLFLLYSVWSVAYNFVPGGEYTREGTLTLVSAASACIALSLLAGRRSASAPSAMVSRHGGTRVPEGARTYQGARVLTPEGSKGSEIRKRLTAERSKGADESEGTRSAKKMSGIGVKGAEPPVRPLFGTRTAIMLTLLTLAGLGGFVYRLPRQHFSHPPRSNFTAAIWTYHFGYDNTGWPSMERAALLLAGTGADVITLLESDASKPFLGNNDLGAWLGEELGMYVDFGPSTRDHTWGSLILSKYPIVKSTHHLLPSPEGELAPAITATIDFSGGRAQGGGVAGEAGGVTGGDESGNGGGGLVDFVVTHMGNDKDQLDRKLQAEFLSNELRNAVNPVVFLGYVTSKPGSRDYAQLTTHGRTRDIDPTDRDRWCEYILYRGLVRLGYARISHGGLSDTEVQAARFLIPPANRNKAQIPSTNQDEVAAALTDNERVTSDPSKVDESIRFNPWFGGYSEGHNWAQSDRHRYHMSTPKYFIPK